MDADSPIHRVANDERSSGEFRLAREGANHFFVARKNRSDDKCGGLRFAEV